MKSPSTDESKADEDIPVLKELNDVVDALLVPMHFLNDLQAVWEKLSEEERAEIKASRVYREKDHERAIESGLARLAELGEQLRGFKHRGLRKLIKQYIAHWKTFEPDQVKILQAQIKQQLG